jgi:glutaredoxin
VLAAAFALPTSACHRSPSAEASAVADAGAPFVVKEDSQGLLLTWIDDKGDFHVEQKAADVPIVGRDAVRVVDPTRDESARVDTVEVADLRVASADGTYPVHTMSREAFDALAESRRAKSNHETLAMAAAPDAGAAPSSGPTDLAVAGRPTVIIYGASWCGACHQAMAYFKKKGITFLEKDIEQDPQAASEMQAKLKRAGLRGGGIPVLDIRGRIMVGFEPHAVEEALGSPI